MRHKNPASPTRARIVDAGQELMLAQGFGGTSVDDICGAASVTKGTFFHYFATKEVLAQILLAQFAERQTAVFFTAAEAFEDPVERVYAVIDSMIAASLDPQSKGCLVGTLAQETAQTHPALRDVCAACFAGMVERVGEMLARARDSAPDAVAFDPKELADYLLSLGQGSLLVAKTTGDRQVLGRNLRHFRSYLTQLLGR